MFSKVEYRIIREVDIWNGNLDSDNFIIIYNFWILGISQI